MIIRELSKTINSFGLSIMFDGISRTTMMVFTAVALLFIGNHHAFGGEIYDYYVKHPRDKSGGDRKSRSYDEVESTNHGITEIGIERTVCFGVCPSYTFIVKSDGTFRYMGFKFVEREGEFSGTIPLWNFHRLAQFVRDSGYMELEYSYWVAVTDNPTTFTTVVMNGKRKTVSNYANGGPTKLWAIEQLTDDLMAKARWDRSPKTLDKK